MAALAITFRPDVLAWASVPEDDARYRRILHTVLVAVALVCLALLLAPKPEVDRAKPPELPPRLAKLLVEKDLPPPVKPKPEAPARAEPEKAIAEAAKPLPKADPLKGAPVPEARNPQPDRPAGEVAAARRKAAGVGLLAMKDEIGALHGAPAACLINGAFHAVRHDIGVENGAAFQVPGGASDGLDQGARRAQEAFFIGVENGDERDFRKVEAFAEQVDADQHVEGAHAEVPQNSDAVKRADLGMQVITLHADF